MLHRSCLSLRTISPVFVLLLGCAVLPRSASAQSSPADMRSGVAIGIGWSTVAAFTVPPGNSFVLTDLDWSPTVGATGDFVTTVAVYSTGSVVRWLRPGTTGGGLLFYPGFHNTTGIVFDSGTTFSVSTSSTLPAWIQWGASWSGYLVPAAVGAVEPGESADKGMAMRAVPNPALDRAAFRFHLHAPGAVVLAVFGVDGRHVRTLHEGVLAQGDHAFTWDGLDDSGHRVPAGLYYAQLASGQGQEVKRLTLIR
jgi:flagellar hook capping protein FlgD